MTGIIRYTDVRGDFNAATGVAAMTIENFRDTSFIMEFTRHDQDDTIGHFKFQMPHSKVLATSILSAHVHCIPCGSNPVSSQIVRFSYSYVWLNSSGTFPANSGWTNGTSNLTIGTTSQYIGVIHPVVSNITPPSSENYSSWLLFRLSRLGTDGADTYTQSKPDGTASANLGILGVDIHVAMDGRSGSINESSD